jgi:hypothetical protein
MKVLIDINEDLFNRIKEVNGGSSLSSFILIAIENQISLEKEQHADLLDFDKKIKKPPEPLPIITKPQEQPMKVVDNLDFLKKPISYENIIEVTLKTPIKDAYIWGQYNKFFALKFAVRYLAYLQTQYNFSTVNLEEYQDKCSKAASQMKQLLLKSDDKAGRVWGEGFSAGLPDNEEKSWSRFKHHFIGYLDSKGNSVGALSDFGFIVIQKNQVGLSSQGLAFAKCHNPILDEDPFASSLFSQEERKFLIDHIKTYIPREWHGIQLVLHWIDVDGVNTPDALTAKFSTLDKEWTEKMANTYRTGTLARMYDLGFITRQKNGIKSKYLVTEDGKKVEAGQI